MRCRVPLSRLNCRKRLLVRKREGDRWAVYFAGAIPKKI